MGSPSRNTSITATGHASVARLSVLCLTALALLMLAAAPAAAHHKHKHKHGHGHGHGHQHYQYYNYDDHDDDVVVIVRPRPVYVALPPVVRYYPAPVVHGSPSINVIIPLDFD